MKRIYEYNIFSLMKDEETYNFLHKVKNENPDLYNRFVSLVGNKGLEVAKEKYKQYDPEWIEEQTRKKSKEEKEAEKERKHQEYMDKYGEIIYKINDYLATSPLKDLIQIIREDPKLKKWIKKYKKLFKGDKTPFYEFGSYKNRLDIAKVELLPPNYEILKKYQEDDINITVIEYATRVFGKDLNIRYSITLNYDIFWGGKFETEKGVAIHRLSSSGKSLDEIKEILEKFKYYMSDQYKKDWEFEQETKKYNL